MFKKLREKLADEVRQSPLRMPGTFSFGNPTLQAVGDVKDQDFPSDNLSLTLSSEQQFSITEDDGTSSEMGSPMRDSNAAASTSKHEESDATLFVPVMDTSRLRSTYVPPSDLESEVEEPIPTPPSLDDSITKEQLFFALNKLHARVQRYKAKYAKVAEACKIANTEKEKIMRTLSTNQDQMLRRMSELREQCNLEKQAKAHLEENLRLLLDEKEDMIGVLKTKIDLLKGGQNPDLIDEDVKSFKSVDSLSLSEDIETEKKAVNASSQDDVSSKESDSIVVLGNKVKRLEELLSRCKNALQSNKERSDQLTLERDRLADQLEKKEQELLKVQEDESTIQSNLRTELSEVSERLSSLKKEQEEMGMAMAETKRSFHQELETREQRLSDTQIELNKAKDDVQKLQQQWQEECSKGENLADELEKMAKSLEDEKNELIQKLSESKSAAIGLLKEQQLKSLKEIKEKWKKKIEESDEKWQNSSEIDKKNCSELKEQIEEMEKKQAENIKKFDECKLSIERLTNDLHARDNELQSKEQDLQMKENDQLIQLTIDYSKIKDECDVLKTKHVTLKQEYELEKQESEKRKSEIKNLRNVEVDFQNMKKKLLELESSHEKSSTELEKVIAERDDLKNQLLNLNSSIESYLIQVNDLTCFNTNISHFVSSVEENTLPLFSLFDDLKFDKDNLDVCGSSLKSAIERIIGQRNSVQKQHDELINEKESQEGIIENLRRDCDKLESTLRQTNVNLEEKSSNFNEVQKQLKDLQANLQSSSSQEAWLSSALSDLDITKTELDKTQLLLQKSAKDYEKLRFHFEETVSCNDCKEFETNKELDSLKAKLSGMENEVRCVEEKHKEAERQINELNKNLESKEFLHEDIQLKLTKNIEQLTVQVDELGQCNSDVTEKCRNLEISLEELDESKVQLLEEVKNLTVLRDTLNEKENLILILKEKSKAWEKEVENFKNKIKTENDQIDQLNTSLNRALTEKNALVKVIEEGSSGADALSNELELNRNRILELEKDHTEKLHLITTLETQLQEVENIGEESEKRLECLRSQVAEFDLEKNKLLSIIAVKTECCESFKQRLEEAKFESKNIFIQLKDKEEKLCELEEECLQLREECSESSAILQKLNDLRSELNDLQREKNELEQTFVEHHSVRENEKVCASKKNEKLEEQIQGSENLRTILQEKCHELEVQVSMLVKEKSEFDNVLANKIEELKAKEVENKNLQQTVTELQEDVKGATSQRFLADSAVTEEIAILQARSSELETEITSLTDEKRNLENCILKTESTLKEKIHASMILESKVEQYESVINDLKIKIVGYESIQQSGLTDSEKLQENLTKLDFDCQSLKREIEEKELKLSEQEELLTRNSEKCMHLEKELGESKSNYDILDEKYQESNSSIQCLEQEMQTNASVLDTQLIVIETLKHEKEDISKKLEKANENESINVELDELKQRFLQVNEIHAAALKELQEKHLKEIQLKEEFVASLKEDLKLRDVQLDECLVVSEANSSGITEELEKSREKLEALTKENAVLKNDLLNLNSDNPSRAIEEDLLQNLNANSDEDYETKLKKLVKYFAAQMKAKEEDHEKEINETRVHYHELEEQLDFQKDQNLLALEKRLAEQSGAIEEMREHFLSQLQEKDDLIMMLQKDNNIQPKSDWDNNWEYEEEASENQVPHTEDGIRHKSDSESKQINQRDSVNHSLCANGTEAITKNNFGGSDLNSGLEPTEYLYLRNILLEYMMGKEPVTLAKVIAAVLRFPKEQTSLILKREEARQHSSISSPSPQ